MAHMIKNSRFNRQSQGGFTLAELLIGIVIATIVAMAGYTVFLSSDRLYNINEDLSEAQQNVRVAMDRLAKDIRAAGFGLPEESFSLTIGGSQFTTPITPSNSSIAPDTITILGIGYEAGSLVGKASGENVSGKGYICIDSDSRFTTQFSNRRYINIGGATYKELTAAPGTTCGGTGKQLTLATPLERSYPDGTVVYIIQAVTYSIGDTGTGCSSSNPCLKSNDLTELRGAGRQTIAENIEDIQFAYGIDSDGDGVVDSYSNNPSNPSQIVAVRVNIVGRTRGEDPSGIKNFTMPCLEDRRSNANCTGAALDGYRRRVLTKIIKLRNPRTGV